MLEKITRASPAKVEILAKQRVCGAPRVVRYCGLAGQKNAISCFSEPDIELGIFIVRKRLVIATDRPKG